jgi:hypothetical protein
VIYARRSAVLSAPPSGETRHQLLRPIPRLPGIIPAVLSAVCFLPPHGCFSPDKSGFRQPKAFRYCILLHYLPAVPSSDKSEFQDEASFRHESITPEGRCSLSVQFGTEVRLFPEAL